MVCERRDVYDAVLLDERSMTLERDLQRFLHGLKRSRERDGR